MNVDGEVRVRPNAVAIYVRWSTEEQGDGTTLVEQMERCKSYLQSQGWSVNEDLIFVDEGYSGGTLHRPAMQRMRKQIRDGEIDCVVTLKVDRLSRSLVDCVDLVLREWNGTCYYKSVSQPVNTTDSLGRVFFAILAGFAEYERTLIKERTQSGLHRRIKEGSFWGAGKPPFGYKRVDTGKLAIDEDEASVVRMVFRMVAEEAKGPSLIAKALNAMGIAGPGGGGWWPFTVRNLLKSRIYAGYMDYGRREIDQTAKAQGKHRLRWREVPLIEGAERIESLALVTDEVFQVAQKMLQRNSEIVKERGRRANSSHLLTGVLRCTCGGRMVTGYDGLKRRYYYCQNRDRANGGRECSAAGGAIYGDIVEPLIGEIIKGRFGDSEVLERLLRERWTTQRAGRAEQVTAVQKQLSALQHQLDGLDADSKRLRRMTRRGEITPAEQRLYEEDIEQERREIAERRTKLECEVREVEAQEEEFEALRVWLAKVDSWEELELQERKHLLGRLIERVEAFKPKHSKQPPTVDVFWKV